MSGPAAERELLATREAFPTLEKGVHLISHSLGALPRKAREHATRFLDEWENDSINAWGTWLPAVRALGDVVAGVVGVAPGTVAILPNVSAVQSAVASCLSYDGPRRRVVYDELNFSTVHYVWQEQVRRGAELVVVPSRDGVHAPIEELCAAIDERTLIVPISHVLFRSSALYDARRVIARAREVGALVLLDCYQSAGTVPLALAEWGCDMACGGSVKWACGGPGAAWLYVRPDLLPRLQPMNAGWFAHAEPFAFDMGPMRWADDGWRMMGGTPAIPAVYTARAGWDVIAALGVERIRAKSLRQTALLRELVLARGFQVNTPRADADRGGTICFDFPGAEAVSKELSRQKFFHDYRPRCGLRVSPHFYTTDDELARFVEALDEVRKISPSRLIAAVAVAAAVGAVAACAATPRPAPAGPVVPRRAPVAVAPPPAPDCPPEMALVTGDDVRVCVDRYEAALEIEESGRWRRWAFSQSVDKVEGALRATPAKGVKPQVNVSELQASAACKAAGKRLCTLSEWTRACRGPDDHVFPYGDEHRLGACNEGRPSPVAAVRGRLGPNEKLDITDPRLAEQENGIAPGGAHPKCVSGFGVFDLHGNVHEWIADTPRPEATYIGSFMGGFFADGKLNGEGCAYRTTAHSKEYHDYSTGFRCCADAR